MLTEATSSTESIRSVAHRPVLVVGVPRSGTSWTANVLAACEGTRLVREPDNEKLSAPAIWAKKDLGRFPVLDAMDRAGGYERLWRWAFAGASDNYRLRVARRLLSRADDRDLENLAKGRRTKELDLAGVLSARPRVSPAGSTVIAKSVHAVLSVGWLASHFEIDVLVVLRHPANVLASWLELELPDRDRNLFALDRVRERFVRPWEVPLPGDTVLERAVWQLGLSTCALEQAAAAHPEWHVRTHEQLCDDSASQFRSLVHDLGLVWGSGPSVVLETSNKPGTGFTESREASQVADSWRTRLSEEQVKVMLQVLRPFPLKTWDPEELSCGGKGSTEWLAQASAPDSD